MIAQVSQETPVFLKQKHIHDTFLPFIHEHDFNYQFKDFSFRNMLKNAQRFFLIFLM